MSNSLYLKYPLGINFSLSENSLHFFANLALDSVKN